MFRVHDKPQVKEGAHHRGAGCPVLVLKRLARKYEGQPAEGMKTANNRIALFDKLLLA